MSDLTTLIDKPMTDAIMGVVTAVTALISAIAALLAAFRGKANAAAIQNTTDRVADVHAQMKSMHTKVDAVVAQTGTDITIPPVIVKP